MTPFIDLTHLYIQRNILNYAKLPPFYFLLKLYTEKKILKHFLITKIMIVICLTYGGVGGGGLPPPNPMGSRVRYEFLVKLQL